MGRPKKKVDVRIIPIDAVNEPKMLVRENMGSREELLELGQSMKQYGQIQPVVVVPNGERFDLIVGHRRLYAAKLVGLVSVEAKVIKAGLAEAAIMRYKENNERLANSPYEEAVFLREMIDNIGCSQIELSKMLGRSAAYVTQRLAILDGYESVRDALRERKISFSQARELLLMPDEKQANFYLDVVCKGGATAELIRSWRNDMVAAYKEVEREELTEEEREIERTKIQLLFRKCAICNSVTDPVDLVYERICKLCHRTLFEQLNKLK